MTTDETWEQPLLEEPRFIKENGHNWKLFSSVYDVPKKTKHHHYKCTYCAQSKSVVIKQGYKFEFSNLHRPCNEAMNTMRKNHLKLMRRNKSHSWIFISVWEAICTTCNTQVFFDSVVNNKQPWWRQRMRADHHIENCDSIMMKKALK